MSQVPVKNLKNPPPPLLNHIRGKHGISLTTFQFFPGLLNQLTILEHEVNKSHEACRRARSTRRTRLWGLDATPAPLPHQVRHGESTAECRPSTLGSHYQSIPADLQDETCRSSINHRQEGGWLTRWTCLLMPGNGSAGWGGGGRDEQVEYGGLLGHKTVTVSTRQHTQRPE